MNHVIGQILIKVGEAVWVLAQGLVLTPQPVAGSDSPKLAQVHHVQRTYVVSAALQVIPPIARLPKSIISLWQDMNQNAFKFLANQSVF